MHIGRPTVAGPERGLYRVTADVDGREVFFESPAPLVPAPEALLSAFLLPAMSRGQRLRIAAPVCPVWMRNVERVREFARRWWSFSGGEIQHEGPDSIEPQGNGRALFFGGGVDSCFSLMREREQLDYLIYVQGYDIDLGDADRINRTLNRDRAVARECGVELLTVRTNLRRHPAVRKLHWLKAYGGALVATAHLLRTRCRTVLMAGWGLVGQSHSRGSHPEMEPGWSSNAVSFSHHGAECSRADKAEAISSWPVAHKYLRVCWEHRRAELNCGECEKCIRTQLEFLAVGRLKDVTTFAPGSLSANIDRIPGLSEHLVYNYQELLTRITDPDIRRSIRKLLLRSPQWQAKQERKARVKRILTKLKLRW